MEQPQESKSKKMQPLDEAKKEQIALYLLKTFHQGGFLNPVSAALSTAMTRDATQQELDEERYVSESKKIAEATLGTRSKDIVNIIPQKDGFKIQHQLDVSSINVCEPGYKKFEVPTFIDLQQNIDAEEEDKVIKGSDKKNVIEAYGEIKIDFSNLDDPISPQVSIEKNLINYNEPRIAKELDKRSLGEIIADFFKSVFGLNKVPEIKSPMEDKPCTSEGNGLDLSFDDNEQEQPDVGGESLAMR